MSVWVRNMTGWDTDPSPWERPAWETDYVISDGETGPRSVVARLSGYLDSHLRGGSGILIAPNVVLTASHLVQAASYNWTAHIGGTPFDGISHEQIREYSGGTDFLDSDLALLKVEDTGLTADDLFGLAVFSDALRGRRPSR